MRFRASIWALLPALTFAGRALADVSPPKHDPSCTVSEQARFPGQCIECCMGDGCPHPEVRCPAEERFHQRCVRFADPPYSAPTYAVWCDAKAKPSGVAAIVMLVRTPAVWLGAGIVASGLGFAALFMQRRSRRSKTRAPNVSGS